MHNAVEHNLQNVTVSFPLGQLIAVTGVSGSGKSTLVNSILYTALAKRIYNARDVPGRHRSITGADEIDKIIHVDQSPIGRTPRSNPATYTGVFDHMRRLFAETPEAKVRGYQPGRFSFNVKGGRCENCTGDGTIKIEMNFLPDVYVPCEVCHGARYNRETLEVHYKGKSISEILDMAIEEAAEFFAAIPAISRHLKTLVEVGLGYVRLGQPAPTLSGGEAQRVKLASELQKRSTGRTLYVLDEPTTGLHFEDIRKLLGVLGRLVDAGNTVVVIEHNLDVIKTADWVIDMGPEGGSRGGKVIAEGTPEQIAANRDSYTGMFLKPILDGRAVPVGAAQPELVPPVPTAKGHQGGHCRPEGAGEACGGARRGCPARQGAAELRVEPKHGLVRLPEGAGGRPALDSCRRVAGAHRQQRPEPVPPYGGPSCPIIPSRTPTVPATDPPHRAARRRPCRADGRRRRRPRRLLGRRRRRGALDLRSDVIGSRVVVGPGHLGSGVQLRAGLAPRPRRRPPRRAVRACDRRCAGRRRGDHGQRRLRDHPAEEGDVQGVQQDLHPHALSGRLGERWHHQLQLPRQQVLHRGRRGDQPAGHRAAAGDQDRRLRRQGLRRRLITQCATWGLHFGAISATFQLHIETEEMIMAQARGVEQRDELDRIDREIEIDASAERVWALVARPGWYVNQGAVVSNPVLETDGDLTVLRHPEHGDFRIRTVSLDPPRYAAFRWLGEGGESTMVEFWITERDGAGVTLRVVESGFSSLGDDPAGWLRKREENVEGWEQELAAAAAYLDRGSVQRAAEIAAPPDRVWPLLTTPDGLTAWYAFDGATVEPVVGGGSVSIGPSTAPIWAG